MVIAGQHRIKLYRKGACHEMGTFLLQDFVVGLKEKQREKEKMLQKRTKWVLIITSAIITVLGCILQYEKVNNAIPDMKYLGQAYIAIGATVFGSVLASMFCFPKHIKRGIIVYVIASIIIVILSMIWFFEFLGDDVLGAVFTIMIGILISIMYECACQLDKKRQNQ